MTGFYDITTEIRNQLLNDPFCNTVNYGDIDEVLLAKQDIFPYAHIIMNNATYEGNIWRFNISVLCMDIVDISNTLTVNKFVGNDNLQDVLNTQLAVLNRLLEVLRRGNTIELDGTATCEPFTDRFEHGVAGWTATFSILIPNTMTVC